MDVYHGWLITRSMDFPNVTKCSPYGYLAISQFSPRRLCAEARNANIIGEGIVAFPPCSPWLGDGATAAKQRWNQRWFTNEPGAPRWKVLHLSGELVQVKNVRCWKFLWWIHGWIRARVILRWIMIQGVSLGELFDPWICTILLIHDLWTLRTEERMRRRGWYWVANSQEDMERTTNDQLNGRSLPRQPYCAILEAAVCAAAGEGCGALVPVEPTRQGLILVWLACQYELIENLSM